MARQLGWRGMGPMSLPEPYYDDGQCVIYHADCRDVLPHLSADVMVTDPPYGIAFHSGWTGSHIEGDADTSLRDAVLSIWGTRPALVFGVAGEAKLTNVPPLVWHRRGSGMGNLALPWKPDYELIHVFGGGFSAPARGSSVLSYPWDVFRGAALHPHQKPINLMRDLIAKCPPGVIVDPFMGSGPTLRACADLHRQAIGIEVDERYCRIAVDRLRQGALNLGGAA